MTTAYKRTLYIHLHTTEHPLGRIDNLSRDDITLGWQFCPVCGSTSGDTMQGSQHALRRITRPEFRRTMPQHPRIVRHSDVWGGKAVVAGTRVPVFMLAARLQSGWTKETILDEYPRLTSEDVQAVILYVECYPARVVADRKAYERSLPAERA